MKKTALVILIATLTIFICLGLTSCSAGESYEGFTVAPNEDGTYTVIGYTGDAAELNVPSVLNGKAVTAIGKNAFFGNEKVTKIVLPDSVVSIGSCAFANCKALTSVEGGKYTSVPSGAFSGSEALSSVVLPEGLTEIGYRAFSGCKALAAFALPESTESIYHYAFADCTALSVFDIKGDGLSVYANAFFGCTALKSISTPTDGAIDAVYNFSDGVMFSSDAKTIVSFIRTDNTYEIPADVTAIAPGAFFGLFGLESLTVAEGNTAFVAIDGVVYSKDQKTLAVYPAGKAGDEYTVPAGVTAIADCAFSGNPLLKKITVADTVSAIGRSAFEGCSALAALDCSALTATVGELAFAGCSSLETYRISDTAPAYKLVGGVLFSADETTLVSYPRGKSETSYTVPATVKTVAPRAFSLASALSELAVAQGNADIKSVGGALYSADGTKLIAVPRAASGTFTVADGVTALESGAFEGCAQISEIILPASITEIPEYAFSGCSALTSLTMNGTVVKVKSYAFSACDALTTVNFKGTQAQWASATAGAEGNAPLTKVTVNYN